MNSKQQVKHAFIDEFGEAPAFTVHAPGRVNLIGEHTDYNGGFVLPLALPYAVWIALRPRDDGQVRVRSLDFEETAVFSLNNLQYHPTNWDEYVKGMAWALQEDGYALSGWEGVMVGDVPIGTGLSSSAALEIVTARAFQTVSDFVWDSKAMALAGQATENKWIGVQTGIMDQMASAAGPPGHGLLIDCRSLETETVPIPSETAVIVMDTGTRRGLVDSAYNERREQCETAARFFNVSHLRDVTPDHFAQREAELDELSRRRARHVVLENGRVLKTVIALKNNNLIQVGQLMNASHASLRDDFEVSSTALDAIVACAQNHPACYGARMTGAGFGGCAVALVQAKNTAAFMESVADCYMDCVVQPAVFYPVL
ncbi:MAG: galactokinase [Chloroflexi bacterium]|nr:galactokinase [Chloroflexota bacterium]